MRKKIIYLTMIILLAIFSLVAFNMNTERETFGKASQLIIDKTISETGAINTVTATVFDFRGYDTLGESIVLFTAISGVSAVLRNEKRKEEN